MLAMIPVGAVVLTVSYSMRALRWLGRKLDRAEDDALASWNMALSGMTPNATIDKLIEEEDQRAA